MTLLRSRRRARATGVPAGITVASLLPLGLMVGASVLEDEDDLARDRVGAAAA
jgi:hypothetical protein